ncbi:MAG: hypothetical protein HW412_629 [Bacteroidetes bacterium]|nr:hypothetical protein [Bacteroidota bacterium]
MLLAFQAGLADFVPSCKSSSLSIVVTPNQNRSYELLVRLIRVGPMDDVDLSILSPGDWEEILREARVHGIIPLLNERLSSFRPTPLVPKNIEKALKESSIAIAFRNTKLYQALEKVLKKLEAGSIPVLVLKGAHLAELVYENIALRPMDDIDLLVHKQDLSKTEEALLGLGYVHTETKPPVTSPHHLTPFVKSGEAAIEIHWTIPPSDLFRIDVDGIWERSRTATISGVATRVLGPEDLLLHLCLHASVHHRFGIGLRPLCDIAETVRRYESELDWDELQQRSRGWGAVTAVYLTLRVAAELVGAAVPKTILERMMPRGFDSRLVDWAKTQVFTRSEELRDNTAMSPRLAGFWQSSFLGKARLLLKAAFPPTDELARIYRVPPRSMRVFWYYPVRLKDLITMRGEAALRLARGDKQALSAAEMFEQLLGDQKVES